MRHVAPGFLAARRVDQLGTELVFAGGRGGAALAAQGRDRVPVPHGGARLRDAAQHRGGVRARPPRRQDEVHAQRRPAGAAGGARRRRGPRARRHLQAGERRDPAGRQAGHRQVPAGSHGPGRRGPVSQPRVPDLLVAHRVLRRRRSAVRLRGGARTGFASTSSDLERASRRGDAATDPQRPPQSHRRGVRRRGDGATRGAGAGARPVRAQRRGVLRHPLRAAAASRSCRGRSCRSAPSSCTRSARSTR